MPRTPTVIGPDLEEKQLVARCLSADPAAWEKLVRIHAPRVYNLCLRFSGNPHDAEDMTQEAFLRVYRGLAGYRPEAGGFAAWVTTIARNLLVDQYRRNRHERQRTGLELAGEIPAQERSPAALLSQKEVQEQVQQTLVQLSPELREVVILRDLQDLDYAEIAAVLAIPMGTVKSRLHRGRVELARRLRPAPSTLPGDPS